MAFEFFLMKGEKRGGISALHAAYLDSVVSTLPKKKTYEPTVTTRKAHTLAARCRVRLLVCLNFAEMLAPSVMPVLGGQRMLALIFAVRN
jgi:hypothetical protein